MAVVRNIQIKLDVPEDAHSVLDETFEQFRQAAQYVADAGWSDDPTEIEDTKNTLEAVENDCTAIAFENLKHIRERISNASKFQQWAFRELQRQVEYKAEESGIRVDDVAPQYTSQRCSHSECGFTHEDNRDSEEFECLNCGKELHADYNAARNIGWRLVQPWLNSGTGRATSQLALKSGTVNANGEYTPAELVG